MDSYDSILNNVSTKCLCKKQTPGKRTATPTCALNFRILVYRNNTLVFVLLMLLSQNYIVTGFNLDVNFSTIATIPKKNSYFGFSVGLYAGEQESWLLVGAPKSQRNGEIFMCKYMKDAVTSNCTVIPIDADPTQALNVGAMFGQTMMLGHSGKELLACAPRYADKLMESNQLDGTVTFYDLVGVCYFVKNFTNTEENVYKIKPCATERGTRKDGIGYGQCEIGFSAAFSKDGRSLFLGAPRALYQGSLMSVDLPIVSDVTKLPLHTGAEKPEGNEKRAYLTQSYDENYLGYTSVTARTIGDREILVTSAPARFRYDMYGMVIVFDKDFSTLKKFTGTQTGEYFGSAIASADLNNDGLDDLIIGAPQYSTNDRKMYETGRIFIYYQTGGKIHDARGYIEHVNFSEPTIIEGVKAKARFGYAISAIGDINQDGYQDIAVGAPYTVNEDESEHPDGSVFIFNGGPDGLVIPASQEIKGTDLQRSLTAFGSSIHGGKDMDRNLYPDIIVGAYLSSHAVMIRSRPVVMIDDVVTTNPDIIDLDNPSCTAKSNNTATNCFKITTCFAYTGKNLPESLHISYTYDIDSGKKGDDKRAFIFDEAPRNITLTRDTIDPLQRKCVEEDAFLEYDVKDKISDIKIKVYHSLIEKVAPIQPVVHGLQPSYSIAAVKIFKECGEDDICQADLRLQSKLSTTQVYAGRSWPFVLEQRIQNKGESAYQTTLVVEYPAHLYYVGTQREGSATSTPPLCTNDDTFVICEVGNPMKHNADVKVHLKFQTDKLNGNFTELMMKSFVNSTNPTNNTSEVTLSTLQIGVKSRIIIENSSSPEGFYFKKEKASELEKNTTILAHTYRVINEGPSDVSKATFRLKWPLTTNDGRVLLELQEIEGNHKLFVCSGERMLSNPHKISVPDGDGNYYHCDGRAHCAAVDCKVDVVFEQLQIRAMFRLPFSTLIQNDLDSFMRSEFEFTIDEYPYSISQDEGPTFKAEVTTEVIYQRKPVSTDVPWWVIVISTAAGLLCLLIITLVLWKCGFFKRVRPDREGNQIQTEAPNPGPDVNADEEESSEFLK